MNLNKKVILENAFDPYHVSNVHKSTVKSLRVIYDNGDMQLLLYELYSFPFLKFLSFLTNKFLVLKTSTKNDVTFISIPTKLEFVSKSKIFCQEITENQTDYTLDFYFKPLSFFYNLLSPIVMKMRNYGENIRLEEDMNLMKLRSEALKNNHKDKPKCIDEKTLLDEWFK